VVARDVRGRPDRVDDLQVGVQIVGPRFREDLVLAAAEAIEARVPKLAPIDPR